MDVGTLKKFRAIVPGALILVGAIPAYTFLIGKPLSAIQAIDLIFFGVGAVLAYALGTLYNLFCLRAVFNGKSHERITQNIKARLLELRTAPLTPDRKQQLLTGNELMNVFYAMVDSNDSLKERAKLVRDNGLVWSSIADATVLGVAFAALYLTLGFTTNHRPFFEWGIGAGIIAFVAGGLLHPVAERRHIQLGNAQLEFIATQTTADAQQRVNAL